MLEGLPRIGALSAGLWGAEGSPRVRGSVFGLLGGITPPLSRMLADSAVLLFLAMPMLAVGGIQFLITNLQV